MQQQTEELAGHIKQLQAASATVKTLYMVVEGAPEHAGVDRDDGGAADLS